MLEAIGVIERGSRQIALVVDAGDRLLGTVTDGDVRRGILRGVQMDSPVSAIMNRQPRTIGPGASREQELAVMRELQINQLPVVDSEGRVIALETLGELLRSARLGNWVVLMAGGLGTRLRPLTDDTPKPMLPVGGRPLLETIIESFVAQGFSRFFVAVNYKADLFKAHFGDGASLGVSIEYLEEDRRLGTAGALGLLPERPNASLVVMNADLLTSVNFRQLLAFHEAHKAWGTMCVREYSLVIPYGVARLSHHRLEGIEEKPSHQLFVNGGIYALRPDCLDLVRPGVALDMTTLFNKLVESGRETAAFPVHEYWLDIGQVDDLERARSEFARVFSR